METEEAAETAIKELNGREVKGRPMKVGLVLVSSVDYFV